MRAIMPNIEIAKRHDLNPLLRSSIYPCKMVVSIRNPLDAIASSIRRYDLEATPEVIDGQIREFQRNGMPELPDLIHRPKTLILKYEEFYQKFDFLFDQLDGFFGVTTTVATRDAFHRQFAASRVKQRADQLGRFDQFSTNDHIHGRHVSERLGQPGGHMDFLNAASVEKIRTAFAWHFKYFGY